MNHCLGKGRLPCELLIIGEAPGNTENMTGSVFCGKAGRLLDTMLDSVDLHHTHFITNVVACRPCDDLRSGFRKPKAKEAEICRTRLYDLQRIARPKGIVVLGRVAERFFKSLYPLPTLFLYHPSYILRRGGWGTPESKTFVKSLIDFDDEMKGVPDVD